LQNPGKTSLIEKMVFAKLKNFFAKLIFFRHFFLLQNSLFQNTEKSFGGKKINLAKMVGPRLYTLWIQTLAG
jgi:hypothetical protein